MKKKWKWLIAVVILVLVAAGIARTLMARKAQQATAAAQASQTTQAAIELAASDIVTVKTRNLAQGMPISGALKAVNSAFIKARVAGELRDLSVREGDAVKAGQIVARVDPSEYESRVKQAQQQADSAKAQIDIAQRQFDNNRALVDQGFISRTALDTSSSNLVAAQANHKAAIATVDVAKKAMDDTVLRSPINGVVAQRLAQPGERVAVDARVIEIVDLSRIELEATLSASDSVTVQVGQSAMLQVEGATQPVAAKVVRINPSAQAGSRSVLAYLNIDKPAGLRQGLFAQGQLGTAQRSSMALPLTAVRTDKPAAYVQAVEGGVVVHKPVDVGARGEADGETMLEVRGLAEGASIIRGTVGPVRAGTVVKFTQAAPAVSTSPAVASPTAAPASSTR